MAVGLRRLGLDPNALVAVNESSARTTGRTAFGSLLREYRLAKRLSQEALAERAKISIEAISALERGTRKAPQLQTLELLMRALELDAAARAKFDAAVSRASVPSVADNGEAVAASSSKPRTNLPRRLSSFVNRVSELPQLDALLSEHALVTVWGAGGVGKTRIALNVGARVAERFPDGVWFFDFARLSDPNVVCAEVASTLDIREMPGRSIGDVLVAALQARRMLLIFDNCEHLIDAIAVVTEILLQSCRDVTILATSREPLRIEGEHLYRLATFEVPGDGTNVDARTAMQFSAIALFTERGIAHEPNFALTDSNAMTVAQLCRRLDGIPMALELAAAKVSVLSASQITERLDRRLQFLADDRRRVEPRQQTIRALIDWSFDLLSAAERTVFARVSVFVGGWTIEAATAVCAGDAITPDDVLTQLASLVVKSLVLSDPNANGGPRFSLYATTREYASERLALLSEYDAVACNHARYMLSFARLAERQRRELREKAWMDMIALELANVRAALSWSLAFDNDINVGAEIASALGIFWFSRRYSEGAEWLATARSKIADLEPPIAARVYLESARIDPFNDQTLDFAERAVTLYEALNDTTHLPESLTLVGQNLINQGRLQEAEHILRRADDLAVKADDTAARARITALLGFSQIYAVQVEPARTYFTTARELALASGVDRDYALAMRGLAEVALCEGDSAGAVTAYRQALDLLESIGDERGAAAARSHLARGLFAAGAIDAARVAAFAALRELENQQLPMTFAYTVIIIAALLLHDDDDDLRAAACIGFAKARTKLLPYHQPWHATELLAATHSALADRLGARFTPALSNGARLDEAGVLSLILTGSLN